jgi:hypothetical protein
MQRRDDRLAFRADNVRSVMVVLIAFIAAGFCVFAGTLYWADVQTRAIRL